MSRQTAPVVIFAFNRPQVAKLLATKVAAANPSIVFLCVDGPRPDSPADVEACEETRHALDSIDWPCPVVRRYSAENLGIVGAIPTGLTAVFQQVDRAIVLEDDCHPDPTFFPFCSELLDRYRHDQRVGMVRGTSIAAPDVDSYYFSRFTNIWGWATWADRWKAFDNGMTDWPEAKRSGWLREVVDDPHTENVMTRMFDAGHSGSGLWDFKWQYACWRRDALAATPSVNLVTNVGFGVGATTTTAGDSPLADRPVSSIEFPLRHPREVSIDDAADRREIRQAFPRTSPQRRLRNRFRALLRR